MKSSRPHPHLAGVHTSSAKLQRGFAANSQSSLFNAADSVTPPGSLNDAGMVRQVIVHAMKTCPLSRAQLAERMTFLAGTEVTERMLNAFAAESREDHRFPSELERAFCAATGDYQLLTCRAELAGLHLVDDTDLHLMELGREFLRQKRATENIAGLEAKLRGVDL